MGADEEIQQEFAGQLNVCDNSADFAVVEPESSWLSDQLITTPSFSVLESRFHSSAKSLEVCIKLRGPNCLTNYWHTGLPG